MGKDLERFHKAQNGTSITARGGQLPYPDYNKAFQEIKNGHKVSHWVWYVFPQLEILGHSQLAKLFGIKDMDEACEYLLDPILFDNYKNIVSCVEEKINNDKINIATLMGSEIDAQKLASSLTLFREVARDLYSKNSDPKFMELISLCDKIFATISKKYPPCKNTLNAIAEMHSEIVQVRHDNKVTNSNPVDASSSINSSGNAGTPAAGQTNKDKLTEDLNVFISDRKQSSGATVAKSGILFGSYGSSTDNRTLNIKAAEEILKMISDNQFEFKSLETKPLNLKKSFTGNYTVTFNDIKNTAVKHTIRSSELKRIISEIHRLSEIKQLNTVPDSNAPQPKSTLRKKFKP